MTESTANQYAPPQAHVADLASSDGVGELKLFSHHGRIGRLRYLAYVTAGSVVHGVVTSAVTIALAASPILVVAAWLPLVVFLWFSIITGIKRCHDMGISGWWSVTSIIPVIALGWIFWPGEQGSNKFGPPPPPNNWGVRILGLLMPVFCVIGILAAVAIPQYKNYTDKARAARAAQQAPQQDAQPQR